ncbi:MAG TPA: hypothetical protein DCM06_12545, partial [Comamonadaceae bacterium]|nr:hypothetical protein [Comamonadaceae bacterium]
GKPAQAVQAVLDFLAQVNANREATRRICLALQQQALIQPWPIKLQGAGGVSPTAPKEPPNVHRNGSTFMWSNGHRT